MVTGWYKAPPEETTSFCVPCHGGTFCSGGTQPCGKGQDGTRVGERTRALLGL